MNTTLLSTDEIHRIAIAILEDCGSTLSTNELREVVFTYLNDISGLETASERDLKGCFEKIVNSYLRSIAGIEK